MVDYYHCRPLAFLFALPFAFIALFLSIVGAIVWLIGVTVELFVPLLYLLCWNWKNVCKIGKASCENHHMVHSKDPLLSVHDANEFDFNW
ncbi:hypothetical protein P3S67_016793 [Capsicum chacoense]